MTDWAAFVGLTGVVVSVLAGLALFSASRPRKSRLPSTTRLQPSGLDPGIADRQWITVRVPGHVVMEEQTDQSLPTGALLANVVLTHGVAVGVLVLGAWYFAVPLDAFGVGTDVFANGPVALGVGTALGVGLWLASELAETVLGTAKLEDAEQFTTTLTPTTGTEWGLMVAVVLPIVAGSEEVIFRAATIGVPVTGLSTAPWALAILSAVVFGVAHAAQGRLGMILTGLIGLALAVAFVLTNSLLAVVVAHYVHDILTLLRSDRRSPEPT